MTPISDILKNFMKTLEKDLIFLYVSLIDKSFERSHIEVHEQHTCEYYTV